MSENEVITLRRQMDDTLRGQVDADRVRLNAISDRLNRVEVLLETVIESFDDHEKIATALHEKLTAIAERQTEISIHFTDHVMNEEKQWEVVNESHDSLHTLTQSLNLTEQKVNNLDRLLWALGGFTLSGFGAFLAWVIQHLESLR